MIGIHHKKGSFSDRWIEYCQQKNIPYKLVNCYQSDIIFQLDNCDVLMWHHHHENYKDVLFAKQLCFSLQMAGKKVFPDFNTAWHFDDKLGQKYLLEAIGAPFVPSYVFYNKRDALTWLKSTTFPKVFKLRRGAGSAHVKLVRSKQQALHLVNKAFGRGFSQYDNLAALKERYKRYKENKCSFWNVCKGIGRTLIPPEFAKMHPYEKGYAYFQEYIPDNNFDIRVIVIGDKAFAIKRMVRTNDFRASGSGIISYEKKFFPLELIKLSFTITQKLNAQCIAYDFIFDNEKKPKVLEISYGFSVSPYDPCVGYWDTDLNFYEGPFIPQHWMVELFLK